MAEVERADADVAALEARLSDPALYAAGGDGRALTTELDDKRAVAARLLARWEELETKREAERG
ncbi:MAG TPA: ABC transporter C-terminal domain-containing protein [Minicystis sp.]|nr:ABC transporter C-terminal domain-containing protein [Minicystis sp.]